MVGTTKIIRWCFCSWVPLALVSENKQQNVNLVFSSRGVFQQGCCFNTTYLYL